MAGVWVGNADNTPMFGVSGVTGAGPIWHDFMETALRHQPARNFTPPSGLTRSEICVDSGLLPTEWCTRRRSEFFIAGTEPTAFDEVYQPVVVDACNDIIAGREHRMVVAPSVCTASIRPNCRPGHRAQGIPQPPASFQTAKLAQVSKPRLVLTSPDPNGTYQLSPDLPAELQQLRIAAYSVSGQPVAITFLVDGSTVGSVAAPPYEIWWTLQPGKHQRAGGCGGWDEVGGD